MLLFPFTIQAFKHREDHSGELSLGQYVSGEGDFINLDPMVFEGGSDAHCGGVARSSEAYWYCWYDDRTDIVSLDHV